MSKKDLYKHLVGKKIQIINMRGEPQYEGKTGVVKFIDDLPSLHGTWGGCSLLPDVDSFTVIDKPVKETYTTQTELAGET